MYFKIKNLFNQIILPSITNDMFLVVLTEFNTTKNMSLVIAYDYKILRLPPFHCVLNPIEMIRGIVKEKVATKNFVLDYYQEVIFHFPADCKNCFELDNAIEDCPVYFGKFLEVWILVYISHNTVQNK